MSQSNYGLIEIIKNITYVLKTKLIVHNGRIIRFPIVIRGKKYIDFGSKITMGARCRIEVHGDHADKRLVFGKNVNIGYDVRITCLNKIEIGNDVLMGSHVLIIDNCHGKYTGNKQDNPNVPPNKRILVSKPIRIEDNVWIGENSVIQMGVNIGYGSIVAANSVVTKDVPAKCMVAGTPAKVIKIFDDKIGEWRKI